MPCYIKYLLSGFGCQLRSVHSWTFRVLDLGHAGSTWIAQNRRLQAHFLKTTLNPGSCRCMLQNTRLQYLQRCFSVYFSLPQGQSLLGLLNTNAPSVDKYQLLWSGANCKLLSTLIFVFQCPRRLAFATFVVSLCLCPVCRAQPGSQTN